MASLLWYEPTTTYVALPGGTAVFMSAAPSLFQLVRPGLTNAPNTLSIMSVERPGWYLRHSSHYSYRLYLEPAANPRNPGMFARDATFIEHEHLFYQGSTAFQSVNYLELFISRRSNRELYIQFTNTDMLKESASFTVNGSKTVFCSLIMQCG